MKHLARSKRSFLSCALVSLCAGGVFADTLPKEKKSLQTTAPSLTLQEALMRAFSDESGIKAQRYQLLQAAEGQNEIRAEWFPQITVHANYTHHPLNFNLSQISQNPQESRGGITIKQPIFAGGSTLARSQKAFKGFEHANQVLEQKYQEVALAVVQASADILAERALIRLCQRSEAFLKKTLDQTKVRREVGEVTQTDVAMAEAHYVEATSKTEAAKGRLEAACATFSRLTSVMKTSVQDIPFLIPLPQTLQTAMELALRQNHKISMAHLSLETSNCDVDEQTANFLPQIDAIASGELLGRNYTNDSETVKTGEFKYQPDIRFQVQLSYPLFSGGRDVAKWRRLEQRMAQARIELEGTRRSIIESVIRAWTQCSTAQINVKKFKLQINVNEQALRGVQEEYTLGAKSLIDVLQIEDRWNHAEASLVDAQRAYVVAGYQLLALTGQLTPQKLNSSLDAATPGLKVTTSSTSPKQSFPARKG